jgi:hypothetical protein
VEPDVPIQKPFPDNPMPTEGTYTGPFRAKVKKNDDRELDDKLLGRVKVWVPQVHGEEYEDRIEDLPWAWPCFLHAYKDEDGSLKAGFFGVPPEESWVYVVFENGNPDYPIYLGGWYAGEKGETDLDDSMQEDSRSSARYPDIIGYISPHDGKFRFRILKGDRFEFSWVENNVEKAIFEFDSIGYSPNDRPTARLSVKENWMIKVSSEDKIEVECIEGEGEVKVKCKKFIVEAEDLVDIKSSGTSKYEAAETNTFAGETIKGRGTPDGGFDRWGVTLRSPNTPS